MKRGIYLVANANSQELCANLINSIRVSGCNLPIRLIHFGGKMIDSPYLLSETEVLHYENFPEQAKEFIHNLRTVLTDCPLGYLYRFLAWFSDWDEFIYSDNDVVSLSNWENLFDYLNEYDLIHADEEYRTDGKFNYDKPMKIKEIFGDFSLETAFTAGHFVVRKNNSMIEDIDSAIEWFKMNPDVPKKHDQSLIHIASLIGKWKILNLCKAPNNWLSSWAGDYKNTLQIIQELQNKKTNISHIHYSGGTPKGNLAIQDLLFSISTNKERLRKLWLISTGHLSGYNYLTNKYSRLIFKIKMKHV